MTHALKRSGQTPVVILNSSASEANRMESSIANRWIEESVDPRTALEALFANWMANLAASEKAFQRYVYENEDITPMDIRQHRMWLYRLLADGESLAIDFLTLDDSSLSQNYVALIDQKLNELQAIYNEWHGPVENDPKIPESLKESFRQAAAGNTVDMKFGS